MQPRYSQSSSEISRGKETIPKDRDKGLTVKLPKKSDLQNCNNWRGITLLSIPSKVFCKILLSRIDSVVDQKLRQEKGGFRQGRSCTDQIFAPTKKSSSSA